ncbi:MAG TPA: aldolase/citrate lyase family protein [Limnochordales bacterium]
MVEARSLKAALRAGRVVTGFQQFLASPDLAELAARAGFDFVVLCTEHGTFGYGSELVHAIRAATLGGAVPLVRVPGVEPVFIHRALEAGAKGVVIPRVRSADEVRRAVAAVKFPPAGERGICPASRAFDYRPADPLRFVAQANEETVVIVLIEQPEAVAAIDEIVAVPGVDAVWFGSGDLSAAMGLRERLLAGDEEARAAVEAQRQRVLAAARRAGVPVAQSPYQAHEAGRLYADGVRVFITKPDAWWLGDVFREYMAAVRDAIENPHQSQALSFGTMVPPGASPAGQ